MPSSLANARHVPALKGATVALTGYRRALVVLLAAASVVGLAGTAAASLPSHSEVAARSVAAPGAGTDSVAGTTIKILGRKRLLQHIGQTGAIMTTNGVTFRAVCTDAGGYPGISVEAKATGSAFLVRGTLPGVALTTSFQQLLFESSSVKDGKSQTYQVLLAHGVTRRFELIYGVLLFGADCMTQLTAYNG